MIEPVGYTNESLKVFEAPAILEKNKILFLFTAGL